VQDVQLQHKTVVCIGVFCSLQLCDLLPEPDHLSFTLYLSVSTSAGAFVSSWCLCCCCCICKM